MKLLIFCSYLCGIFLSVASDAMVGPGKWRLLKMEKSPSDMEKFEFDIVQRKYNRTHDVFQGAMNFHEDLSDMCGVKLDMCKHVDGGCKQYQVISDDSFISLVKKYAETNFNDMLGLCGIKDTNLPIHMGNYKFKEYLWNWDELPEEGPYGHFNVEVCVMEKMVKVGCLLVELMFEEIEDKGDEDDCDE